MNTPLGSVGHDPSTDHEEDQVASTGTPELIKVTQVLSVDNGHCHLYGICEQEAPAVFALKANGRLAYTPKPAPEHLESVRHAARLCPMQAIDLQEKRA